MKTVPAGLIVCVLIVSFFALPAEVSAKGKRGADIVVTKLDGSRVSGELIAVNPDSLLLLGDLRRTESVDRAQIKSIRIIKRSRAGKGAFIGSMGGILTGVVLGAASGGIDEFTSGGAAVWLGITLGVVGGLGGLVVGSSRKTDTTLTLAGEPEEVVSVRWERLREHSREGRLRVSSRLPSPSRHRPS